MNADEYLKDQEKNLQVKSIKNRFSHFIYSALAELHLPFKSFWNPSIYFTYKL